MAKHGTTSATIREEPKTHPVEQAPILIFATIATRVSALDFESAQVAVRDGCGNLHLIKRVSLEEDVAGNRIVVLMDSRIRFTSSEL